jgi:fucose permease
MELIRDSNKKWRRARWGVALMFFTNGAVIAGLLPRYPELKDALGLSNAGFGALVAAVAVGSLVASGLPAVAIRRFGARRTATVGTVLMAAVMALVGISPAVWAVALLLGAVGLLDAVVDAAQNVHGLFVQEGLGKTVINSMHASWSIGAALGGLGAALAQGAGVGLGIHLGVSGLLVAAVAVLAYFAAAAPSVSMGAGGVSADADGAMRGGAGSESGGPPGPSGAEGVEGAGMRSAGPGATASARPRPGLRGWAFLMLLALMAVAGALIEDVGNNWSANFLRDSVGLPLAFVGYGYVTLLVFQFLGRILGDPLTDRFGRDWVAMAGGALIALGFGLVILQPAAWSAFAAFALAGFGCATLIPAAYAEANRVPGFRDGTGITVVGWVMRIGFLFTSPAIGLIADAGSLRLAFVIPLVSGCVVVAIAVGLQVRARRVSRGG